MSDSQQGSGALGLVDHVFDVDGQSRSYDGASAGLSTGAQSIAFQSGHTAPSHKSDQAQAAFQRAAADDTSPVDANFAFSNHWLRRPRFGSGESFSTDRTSRPQPLPESSPVLSSSAVDHGSAPIGSSSNLCTAMSDPTPMQGDPLTANQWAEIDSQLSSVNAFPVAGQSSFVEMNVNDGEPSTTPTPNGIADRTGDCMDWDSDDFPLQEHRSPASESSISSAYLPTAPAPPGVSEELLRNLGIGPIREEWWPAGAAVMEFDSPPQLRLDLLQPAPQLSPSQEVSPPASMEPFSAANNSPHDAITSRRRIARSPTAATSAQPAGQRKRHQRSGDFGGPGPIRPSSSNPSTLSVTSLNVPHNRRRSGTVASPSYQQLSISPASGRNYELYSSRELRAVMSNPSFQQSRPSMTVLSTTSEHDTPAVSADVHLHMSDGANSSQVSSNDVWLDSGSDGIQRSSSLSVHLASMDLHAGANVAADAAGDTYMSDKGHTSSRISRQGSSTGESRSGGERSWMEDETSYLSNDTSVSTSTSPRGDDSVLSVQGVPGQWQHGTPQSSPSSSQIYPKSSQVSMDELAQHTSRHVDMSEFGRNPSRPVASRSWSSRPSMSYDQRERHAETPAYVSDSSLPSRQGHRGVTIGRQRGATQSSNNSESADPIAEEEEFSPIAQSSDRSQTWPRTRTTWGGDGLTQLTAAPSQSSVISQQRRGPHALPQYGSTSTISSTSSSHTSSQASSGDRRPHVVYNRGGPQPTLAQMLASGDSASDRSQLSSVGTSSTTSSSSASAMRGSVSNTSKRSSYEGGPASRSQGPIQQRGIPAVLPDYHGRSLAVSRSQDLSHRDHNAWERQRSGGGGGSSVSNRPRHLAGSRDTDSLSPGALTPNPVQSILSTQRGAAIVDEAARRERTTRVGYNEVSAALDTLRIFLRQRERDADWIRDSDSRGGSVRGSTRRPSIEAGEALQSGRTMDGSSFTMSPSRSGSGESGSGSVSPGGSSSRPRTLRRTHGTLPPRGSVQIDEDERGAFFAADDMSGGSPSARRSSPFNDMSGPERQSLAVLSDLSERVTMLRQRSQRWANQNPP